MYTDQLKSTFRGFFGVSSGRDAKSELNDVDAEMEDVSYRSKLVFLLLTVLLNNLSWY